jgi:hypothetical protein
LDFFLDRVASRLQHRRLAWLLAAVWFFLAAGITVLLFNRKWLVTISAPWSKQIDNQASMLAAFGGIMVVLALIAWGIARQAFRDRRWLAARVEKKFPGLDHRLLTAVSAENKSTSNFLRRTLLDETVLHAATHDWRQVVTRRSMMAAWIAQTAALFGLASVGLAAAFPQGPLKNVGDKLIPLIIPSAAMTVEPGNADIERGTSCLVTVRFRGELPSRVLLSQSTASGSESVSELKRSLKDPIFSGRLAHIEADTTYRIETEGRTSEIFTLKVFDYPALVRSDAVVDPPAYAGQSKKTIEDTRRVTVPDGTKLTWLCRLNKLDVKATLIDESGGTIDLKSTDEDALLAAAEVEINANRKWKLQLIDRDGRRAKHDEVFQANVILNQPPTIKNKSGDLTVSAVEEVDVSASIREDFGLLRSGIVYQLGDGALKQVVLTKKTSDATTQTLHKSLLRESTVSHRLDFEALKAEPDQLLSYFFWAEDLDRGGNLRRVDGEMFFGEVRPFDEIFREGQSSAGPTSPSRSPQGQQADELAELQKKILSGTWNLLRSTAAKIPDDDVQILIDSQNDALSKTEPLSEELRDDTSKQHLAASQKAMQQAADELSDALKAVESTNRRGQLREAVSAEQKAYEQFLKLRDREHQIVRSQQQSSRSQSTSRRNRQQQIDQLKLDDDQERYESEREANPQEVAENRELRQVMNRLDELARRQEDLNRRLKDLETALQEAKSEEQKRELEDQLKRLRENQDELLRDSDELLNRMQQSQNNSENREPMRQAQERVEQARQNVQQASQALSQENPSPSQALSSGSRAERQFQETREQLRTQSAERFEEAMRSMRDEAVELEKKQRSLSEKTLGEEASPAQNEQKSSSKATKLKEDSFQENSGGLRNSSNGQKESTPEEREKAWQEQHARLQSLWDKMQETVAEAESSEPLLAEKLYETYRSTKQQGLDEKMERVPQLIERGFEEPVRQSLEELTTGVKDLRRGVEKAAESVLGSEEAGLRRALNELDRARRELASDLRRAGEAGGQREDKTPANDAKQNASSSSNQSENALPSPRLRGEGSGVRGEAKEGDKQSETSARRRTNESENPNPETSNAFEAAPQNSMQSSTESAQQNAPPNSTSSNQADGDSPRGESDPNQPSQSRSARRSGEASSDLNTTSDDPFSESSTDPSNSSSRRASQADQGGVLQNLTDRRGGNASPTSSNNENLEGPFSGGNFVEWSDRLREAEESIRDPELRASASAIRQAAREALRDSKRHAKEPQWDLIRRIVAEPLSQLREDVQLELLKRSADRNAVVPIDRDPVPIQFEEQLRQYYENLSSRKHVP